MSERAVLQIGQTFNYLTVVGYHGKERIGNGKYPQPLWDCVCACGNKIAIPAARLTHGNTKSCGCAQRRLQSDAIKTHGMSRIGLREYRIWQGMKRRCLNPRNPAFGNYGGRGIKVCEQWLHSFEAFYADMGPRPSDRHTIERIKNNRGYSPENCTWATRKDQANNTRRCRRVKFRGVVRTIAQWAEILKMRPGTIYSRLFHGWPVHEALSRRTA